MVQLKSSAGSRADAAELLLLNDIGGRGCGCFTVSSISSSEVFRGVRPVGGDGDPDPFSGWISSRSRLPLLGAQGLWQDHRRPHIGEGFELSCTRGRGAVLRVPKLPGDLGGREPGCGRDRWSLEQQRRRGQRAQDSRGPGPFFLEVQGLSSEEHTSELQSR